MRKEAAIVSALVAVGALIVQAATAQMAPAAQRGMIFVQVNCGKCHATDRLSESPLPIAPPLRDLSRRFPAERLSYGLVNAMQAGHLNMPAFQLDPGQLDDVVAYLRTLGP
jgi:cytochrome c